MTEKKPRKTSERRETERRKEVLPIVIEDRRGAQRRNGKDRRNKV